MANKTLTKPAKGARKTSRKARRGDPTSYEGRWKFRDRADLIGYLAERLGVAPETPGSLRVRGAQLSGKARRTVALARSAPERRARFRADALNLITSPDGMIEVGGLRHDVTAALRADRRSAGASNVAFALACEPDFGSGFERCMSDDGSRIEYRSGSDKIVFRTYGDSNFLGYWEMGAKITTEGPNFERAQIDSRYYFTAFGQTCTAESDSDRDSDDDYLDEYEWGIFAERPIRLVSLCRAQWKGRRISGIVTRGAACLDVGSEPLPDGYPDDWPAPSDPQPGTVSVSPRSLTLTSRPERPTGTRNVLIENSHDAPKEVTVGPVTRLDPDDPTVLQPQGVFSNTSGTFTIPPQGSVQVAVSFTGQAGFGSLQARMPVSWDDRVVNVAITGTLLQVISP